jgi:hypothetical protein
MAVTSISAGFVSLAENAHIAIEVLRVLDGTVPAWLALIAHALLALLSIKLTWRAVKGGTTLLSQIVMIIDRIILTTKTKSSVVMRKAFLVAARWFGPKK